MVLGKKKKKNRIKTLVLLQLVPIRFVLVKKQDKNTCSATDEFQIGVVLRKKKQNKNTYSATDECQIGVVLGKKKQDKNTCSATDEFQTGVVLVKK